MVLVEAVLSYELILSIEGCVLFFVCVRQFLWTATLIMLMILNWHILTSDVCFGDML